MVVLFWKIILFILPVQKILLCPESVRVFIIQQQRIVQYAALLLCKLAWGTNTLSYSARILITDQQNIMLCYQGSTGCFVFRLMFVFGGLVIVRCVFVMRQAKVSAVLLVATRFIPYLSTYPAIENHIGYININFLWLLPIVFQIIPDICSYGFTFWICRFATIRFYSLPSNYGFILTQFGFEKHNCVQMQNGPSRWKLEPPLWFALGRMSHCEEVVLVLTLATSRRTSVKSILKGEQQIKLRNKDKKKKIIISPHLIQNFFSTIFCTLLSLPPNYTALLTTSYGWWPWVLIKTLLYYYVNLNYSILFAENKKYRLIYVSHFTPLSLNLHQSTGSHLTHACWVCYHSYNSNFFPSQTIIWRLFPPIGSHCWRCSMK